MGSVRRECLDWLLMTGEGHFPKVLGEYERHYNQHHHRSRNRQPPQPPQPAVAAAKLDRVRLKREEVPQRPDQRVRTSRVDEGKPQVTTRARVSAPHKPASRISA